jgi:hypothetical protein
MNKTYICRDASSRDLIWPVDCWHTRLDSEPVPNLDSVDGNEG